MIEFRKVNLPDDLAAIHELDRKIFTLPGDRIDTDEWLGFDSHWMLDDNRVAGCSAFLHHVDYDETPRPGSLYIVSTGILPERRGQGLGRKMKQWQVDYAKARGFSVLVTNMRVSNRRIVHLNEQLGFRRRAIHPNFYFEPDEDALVMELDLAGSAENRGTAQAR